MTVTVLAGRVRRTDVLHCAGRTRTVAAVAEYRPGLVEIRLADNSLEWLPAGNRVRINRVEETAV